MEFHGLLLIKEWRTLTVFTKENRILLEISGNHSDVSNNIEIRA